MKTVALFVALIAGCHAATLDTPLTNTSALFGSTATFTCVIGGTQSGLETLNFNKVDGSTSTLISSNAAAANATKHSVSGTYTLTINDVVWTDEGEYNCILNTVGQATAYLTVGVAPTTGELYWNNNNTWTPKDQAGNLTCAAGSARPPATFRWFRGSTQVTTGISNPASTVDANGYGTAVSYLTMTPSSTDEGIDYTCFVDAAGQEGALNYTLAVAFSGAKPVAESTSLLFAAIVAAFVCKLSL